MLSRGAWLRWRSEQARFSGAPLPGPRKAQRRGPGPLWRAGPCAGEEERHLRALGEHPDSWRACPWTGLAAGRRLRRGRTQLGAVAGSGLDWRPVVGSRGAREEECGLCRRPAADAARGLRHLRGGWSCGCRESCLASLHCGEWRGRADSGTCPTGDQRDHSARGVTPRSLGAARPDGAR
ncbi:hypothetical protein NDU88_002903 [Pleurodeles waltl]|uniref:Uncharacterized protein n=1 Tax=Pleurodeles waltl TaxID=8319 RepID=A0AAV7M1Z0_PLEWA|nr:hypothetical protein NDU88_002903 [Pleurodeles waltl]